MTIYTFVGKDGQYIAGVPARDLGDDDLEKLSDEQKAAVKGSPLYKQKKARKVKEKDDG